MIEQTMISAGGVELAADLYLPDKARRPVPAVVTGSGFGGVKEMLLPVFAKALAEAGIATLAIDFAGFGASAGTPRQEVDPNAQIADLRRGLTYLAAHPDIDAKRLGVWGPSMCGAHALVIAGTDPRVRAAVSIIPFVKPPEAPPKPSILVALVLDSLRRIIGRPGGMIAVSGNPKDRAVMTTDGALAWIASVSAAAPRFRNEVTLASLLKVGAYHPMRLVGAAGITIPLRTILAEADTITPAAAARSELAAVVDNDVIVFPDTHFELFDTHLSEVIRLTVEWFCRHLRTNDASTHQARDALQSPA
jgi:fermentation-respiration switch protein FrsA (DUF1100 family)